MKRWLCGLLFKHLPEHGDTANGQWYWYCLRCKRYAADRYTQALFNKPENGLNA